MFQRPRQVQQCNSYRVLVKYVSVILYMKTKTNMAEVMTTYAIDVFVYST